jgi:hypothetical protein
MTKLLAVVAIFFCCCGFTDARLTGVWIQKDRQWEFPELPQATAKFAYFTPSGKFVFFELILVKDKQGLPDMLVQDGQEIYFGVLNHRAPTRVATRMVNLTPSKIGVHFIRANADGTIEIDKVIYRKLTDTGDDVKLAQNFDSMIYYTNELKGRLRNDERCPYGCRSLW